MFFCQKREADKNRRRNRHVIAAMLLFIAVISGNRLPLQAADFKHVHTGSCYTQGMGACTSQHVQSTRTGSKTRHCPGCLMQVGHTEYVYWDRCSSTGQEFEMGGKDVCNQCGTTSYVWGGSGKKQHQVSRLELSCRKSEAAAGRLWMKNTTPEWTAEDVVLEAGITILDSTFSEAPAPFSWDGQTSWGTQTVFRVTQNGSYSVFAQDSEGRVVQETLTVNNIDRTPPVLAAVVRSEEEWTNQAVTLTLFAEDRQPDGTQGCGLADRPYSCDGGESFTDEQMMTVSENGSFDVVLADRLGNEAEVSVVVSNIDTKAPEIMGVVPIEEGWQPESITMKVQAQDAEEGSGLHAQSYSLDGENWQESAEFLFTENGTYEAFVRDRTGNQTSREFVVDKIDTTAPVIERLETFPDKIWDDKVLVVIHAKDIQPDGTEGCGFPKEAYSVDGGKTWQAADNFYAEKGQTYDIRVRDALLHLSEEYVVTRESFPYPPKGETAQDSKPAPEMPTEEPGVELEDEEPVKEEFVKEKAPKEKRTDKTEQYERERQKEETKAEKTLIEKVTKENGENLADRVLPVETLHRPWYATAAGTAALIGTGTAAAAGSVLLLLFLYRYSMEVYCLENGKQKKLGRVFLHRSPGGYRVHFPEFMVQEAGTAHYRMKISAFLLKRLENARLLIESEGKSLEVVVQETMDFVL